LKLLLVRSVMRILSWITPPVAEKITPPLAAIIWFLSPDKRRVTLINLKAVYPDLSPGEREKIARASMVHYVRGIFEAGMVWHWPMDRILACFDEIVGREHYESAKSFGRGVIFASIHGGAWELSGLYMQSELDGSILYKPGPHADIEAMLVKKRGKGGARFIPTNKAGIKTTYQNLQAGETVAMVMDQEPSRGGGQFAPLFGVEALSGVFVPRLVQRTGAKVVFAVCERRRGGRYRIHLFNADDAMYAEDMRAALTAMNHGVEQCIEVDTEQYLWAYRRFRNRPGGEKGFYKAL